MFKFLKKIFFLILCLLFTTINYQAYALLKPSIDFDRSLGIKEEFEWVRKTVPKPGADSGIPISGSSVKRNISLTEKEIISFYKNHSISPSVHNKMKVHHKNYKNYNILIIYDNYNEFRCVYILDRKKVCIGYYLIDPYFEITKHLNYDVVLSIKSLSKNTSYSISGFILPNGATIDFHEKENNNFIERYGILKYQNEEILLLDSFYPKELEPILSKYFTKIMNKHNKKQEIIESDFE